MPNQNQVVRQAAAVLMVCGLIASLLPGFAVPCLAQAAAGPNIPELPELKWEKRSDWLDVTRDISPAAVGDGKADDTAALQAAFDRVRQPGSAFSTVYLPPGTYRITREVYPSAHSPAPRWQTQMHVRGHGRSTRIVWHGPNGGRMFRSDGATESTYVGIVWDGRGIAAKGVEHDSISACESLVKYQHVAFMNFTDTGCGSAANKPDQRYVESSEWRNCLFINCGKGLAIRQFNDYLIMVDGCNFYNCGYGIWNAQGCFYARNCHFERSSQADIGHFQPANGCSVRRCTSTGSRAFVQIGQNELPSWNLPFTIQDCHVSGWTSQDWAIYNAWRGPLLIFDCVFTNPPSANPPIFLRIRQWAIHSNNTTSTNALFGGSTQYVFEVPPGQRRGSIGSAQQSFFRSEAPIPTRVFDAKRDFGAAGNGSGDDTDAVQRCIDAARQYGRGAIAYLPRGNYRVSRTIQITGGDYYVGGAGAFKTDITWGGNNVGPIFLVSDPQNVTMEYLRIRNSNLRTLIRQVSTTRQPSRMHYEHVTMDGAPFVTPETFKEAGAFEAVGLSKDSVLTAYCFHAGTGGLSFDNCSSARILLNHVGTHSMGTLRLRGTPEDRDGFFGILTGHTRYRIEDNQSLVGSDCYVEQMGYHDWSRGPHAHLRGTPTLPAGRVTLSSPKRQGSITNFFTVDNYRGRLSSVMAPWLADANSDMKIVVSGEATLDILQMGDVYGPSGKMPQIEGVLNGTHTRLGCYERGKGWNDESGFIPNVLPPNGLRWAALALDDFRELGEHDLALNHAAPFLKLNLKPELPLLPKRAGNGKQP